MALPVSRNRTYGPGSTIASADLNDLMDQVIDGKHGALSLMIHPATGINTDGNVVQQPNYWEHGGGAPPPGEIECPIELPVGTRVDGIIIYCEQATDDQVEAEPFKTDADADSTLDSIATAKQSGTGAGHKEIVFTTADTGFPYTVGDGDTFQVRVTLEAGGSATRYKGIKLTIVRP